MNISLVFAFVKTDNVIMNTVDAATITANRTESLLNIFIIMTGVRIRETMTAVTITWLARLNHEPVYM